MSPQQKNAEGHAALSSSVRGLAGGRGALLVFCLTFAVGLGFTLLSDNMDMRDGYYLGYRTSKHLATGQGLAFAPGQRAYTTTSPLNTLLAAGLSYVTGNGSDGVVLWLCRVLSLGALASAAVLLYKIARAQAWGAPAICVLIGLFAADPKTVDFSINGRETGLMMLFLALTLHALIVPGRHSLARLALAWAGLLWTRPDGCVYIALIGGAFVLFNAAEGQAAGRLKLMKRFVLAAAIAALLYAPWLIFAWWYYGSPVPQIVFVHALDGTMRASSALPMTLWYLIQRIGAGYSLHLIFAPAYAERWPVELIMLGTAMTWLASWYWLLPIGRAPAARAVSLAFLAGGGYLAVVAPSASLWNYPNVAILAIYVIAHAVQQAGALLALLREALGDRPTLRRLRWVFHAGVAVLAGGEVLVLVLLAQNMCVKTRQIEDGQRREIGLWLRDHARGPDDSVFVDQAGFVGYYSQLRMFDWPGVSSPQVLAARRSLAPITAPHWAGLIERLHPDWLVLRPQEADVIKQDEPLLLHDRYAPAKVDYYYVVYAAKGAAVAAGPAMR